MPIYDYHCETCNRDFELMHSMASHVEYCDCGNMGKITKIIGVPSIIDREKNSLITDIKQKYLPDEYLK